MEQCYICLESILLLMSISKRGIFKHYLIQNKCHIGDIDAVNGIIISVTMVQRYPNCLQCCCNNTN